LVRWNEKLPVDPRRADAMTGRERIRAARQSQNPSQKIFMMEERKSIASIGALLQFFKREADFMTSWQLQS
jgi:hypothetical protein